MFVPGTASSSLSLPVVIFVHGGGFQWEISQETYRAPGFAASNNLIFVTFNYRLSAFGYLASPDIELLGNFGLWDQHMAIKWIHDHIAAFGGDPKLLTLIGHASGAASVMYQVMYEGNEGLLQNAVIMSGPANAPWAYSSDQDATQSYFDLTSDLNCNLGDSIADLQCLRDLPSSEIMAKVKRRNFLPVVDREFIKVSPNQVFEVNISESVAIRQRLRNVNMVIGSDNFEAAYTLYTTPLALGIFVFSFVDGISYDEFRSAISPALAHSRIITNGLLDDGILNQYYAWQDPKNTIVAGQKFVEMISDAAFLVPILDAANSHASEGIGKTYFYEFIHRPTFSPLYPWVTGANHADELGFLFGFPTPLMDFYWPNATGTTEEVALSKGVSQLFAAFASNANPNIPGRKTWPQYTLKNKEYMVFESGQQSFEIRQNQKAAALHFWKEFVPKLSKNEQLFN